MDWEILYEDHAERVFAYSLRRVSREDALDVVAETFLVAWRRLDDIPEDPIPWLLRVASNVMSNQERSARRRDALKAKLTVVDRGHLSARGDPAEEIGSKEVVLELLANLPKAEREALLLVTWEDLDIRSAANALGCSSAALAVRLHRARKRLKKELKSLGAIRVTNDPATRPELEEGEAR